jgi:hypothetical protein
MSSGIGLKRLDYKTFAEEVKLACPYLNGTDNHGS